MKKKKGLIIAVIALVFLTLVYVLLKKTNVGEDEQNSAEDTTETAFQADEADISGITIESSGKTYAFVYKGEKWYCAEDEKFPLDETAFETIVSSLSTVSSTRTIENPDDMGDFGLENPEVKAVIKTGDDTEKVLNFGDVNDAVSGCYMNIGGDESNVYLVDASLKTQLQFELNDLAEKEEITSITGTTIQKVTIDKKGTVETLGTDGTSETGWTYQDAEGNTMAADSSKVLEYMNGFASLAWTDFVSYDTSDLTAFGLDQPTKVTVEYQVEETVDSDDDAEDDTEDAETDSDTETDSETETVKVNKQAVLLIGAQDSEGNYYAKFQENKYIYTMSSELVESILNIEKESLASTLVADYSFADLDKITFVRNDVTYVVTKKEVEVENESDESNTDEDDAENEVTTETKYYINDKEIDTTSFSTFFTSVNSMEWQSKEENLQAEGTPEMTITLEKEGGISNTIEYYSYDANFSLVLDSKGNEVLVNKMKVKEMLESFDGMIEEWNE